VFVSGKPFQPSLMFEGKAGDKHSSLLQKYVNYVSKKLYSKLFDTRQQCGYCTINLFTAVIVAVQ